MAFEQLSPLENMMDAFTGMTARQASGMGYNRAMTSGIDSMSMVGDDGPGSLSKIFGQANNTNYQPAQPTAQQTTSNVMNGIQDIKGYEATTANVDRADNLQKAETAKEQLQAQMNPQGPGAPNQNGGGNQNPSSGAAKIAQAGADVAVGAVVGGVIDMVAPGVGTAVNAAMTAKAGASYFQSSPSKNERQFSSKSEPLEEAYVSSAQSQDMLNAMNNMPGLPPVNMSDINGVGYALAAQDGCQIPVAQTKHFIDMNQKMAQLDRIIDQSNAAPDKVSISSALANGEMRMEDLENIYNPNINTISAPMGMTG